MRKKEGWGGVGECFGGSCQENVITLVVSYDGKTSGVVTLSESVGTKDYDEKSEVRTHAGEPTTDLKGPKRSAITTRPSSLK